MKSILSIICNKKVKNSLILLFLLFLYISISAISYVNAVSSDIENSVFRLHVIANSDTKEDQDLKYKIRDNLIEQIGTKYINEEINNNYKKHFLEICKLDH